MEGGNIINITFDRMTVMGDLSDNRVSLLNQLIKKYSIARENKIHVSDTRYHSYIRGKFLDDLVYFEYDRLKAKSFNTRNFRIEFNPNNLNSEQIEWLQKNVIPILTDVGITRLDLAFDVDFKLSNYQFINIGNAREKSTVEFRNPSQQLETLYIGKRESDKMIRLYDKKVEQMKKGNEVDQPYWWRLEFELKRETVDEFADVFETLQIKKPDLKEIEKIQDRAMLYYLRDHPEEWAELGNSTKSKYRKMLREIKNENMTPLFKKELKKKKAELLEQLDGWFKNQYRIFEKC
ncbi:replication initiation factor domain-containing protein [Priestia megaterium]|uniref:replication initiation factor domain-containing protein n=1 Tax=Priestia TaxID=2800373 RepID=UPI0020415817|nr:replication initiation factor domain-containing protein [Priestia aryabhattai]MCM3645158.1 replication initiation factor domain-containing protein [Priestia aryabhattai]